eukprot:GHVU01193694.1.p2 GENE.GHVU01193694.1~~GHVU01193694.1.p2  ORF type:complete len:111 (+),score=16.29 GHVU01193694.1:66-398(+)
MVACWLDWAAVERRLALDMECRGVGGVWGAGGRGEEEEEEAAAANRRSRRYSLGVGSTEQAERACRGWLAGSSRQGSNQWLTGRPPRWQLLLVCLPPPHGWVRLRQSLRV